MLTMQEQQQCAAVHGPEQEMLSRGQACGLKTAVAGYCKLMQQQHAALHRPEHGVLSRCLCIGHCCGIKGTGSMHSQPHATLIVQCTWL